MKIDTNLRAAIRSACQTQREAASSVPSYELRNRAAKALVNSRPEYKKAFANMAKAIKQAEEIKQKARDAMPNIGVDCDFRIRDEELFVAGGGVLPVPSEFWKFDSVMKEVAAADPKEGEKILKKYGINWR